VPPRAPAAVPAPAAGPAAAAPPAIDANAVPSPMVGTVYLQPDPEAPSFKSIGDAVKEGDTIVIIEAMKVMNAITAPRGGTLTAVYVENGQPVEYDQPLFVIA
jgi:acetyl-CoA carboxylase biotin carboxyl carrier protein